MLLGDRSLSSVFLSFFWILFHESTAFPIIEYFPYLLVIYLDFIRLPSLQLGVS